MQAGISTLGVKAGYAVETTAGQKPTSFNWLSRISAIGGISLETEQLDASALEDYITRYIAGRQDSGGSFSVTVNLTDDEEGTIKQWQKAIADYNSAELDGKGVWFEIWHPTMQNGWFIVVQLPQVMPMPEFNQNEVLTVEIPLTINDYKGMSAKIEPTDIAV